MKPLWIPVSRLMRTARLADRVVARRPDGDYRWQDLERHLASLCTVLSHHARGRWLLSCESSYAFCVGLLALWHTGNSAVLAPNQQPGNLLESASGVQGLISDGVQVPGLLSLPALNPVSVPWKWKNLNPKSASLELFTSGSSGMRKSVRKTLAQLERELTVLEKTFGKRVGLSEVYASVSHQHIYGLLFRLLWPLCAGRPFAAKNFLFWEELTPILNGRKPISVVSSPAHLERLSSPAEKMLRSKSVRAIFSSGGPLRSATADHIRKDTGHAAIEVYGSTETGGIGWRQRRSLKDQAWKAFDGVTVAEKGARDPLLAVQTRFAPQEKRIVMGDCGHAITKKRFVLLGRNDRIVKIAEKRISLDEMEKRLLGHPAVQVARLTVIGSGDGKSSIAAAIVLHPSTTFAHKETAERVTSLRAHLAQHFESATLPRDFRFVDDLPRDAMGKITQQALASLFSSIDDKVITTPHLVHESRKTGELLQRLKVPADLIYLKGHFPDYPIVPGIVQLKWVIEAVTPWLGKRPVIRRMDSIKFKKPLLPGQTFMLEVEHIRTETEAVLNFHLREQEVIFSSGRLVLS